MPRERAAPSKMGRPTLTATKRKLATLLEQIQKDSYKITNHMKHRLVEEGYIRIEQDYKKSVGRPKDKLLLTPKGAGLVNLSKAWKDVDHEG